MQAGVKSEVVIAVNKVKSKVTVSKYKILNILVWIVYCTENVSLVNIHTHIFGDFT